MGVLQKRLAREVKLELNHRRFVKTNSANKYSSQEEHTGTEKGGIFVSVAGRAFCGM